MIEGQLSKEKRYTLGADPEIFVFAGNKLMPAFTFLPSKDSGLKLYWDGFQAEWKYDHHGNQCLNTLVYYTRERLMELANRAFVHASDAKLSLRNVVRVPNEMLTESESQYVELGCMPSFNAYGLQGKDVPDPRKLHYRFAGGHMHFGAFTRRPQYQKIVKVLDNILGVWAVGAARNMDNPVRRQYYGLPGEFRKPLYPQHRYDFLTRARVRLEDAFGLEYRVLSNFWLASPAIMQLTWDLGRMAVRVGSSLKYNNLWVGSEDETVDVIKNCDVDRATQIINRNEPMLRWMLGQEYRKPRAIDMAIDIAKQGLEVMVPNPEAIAENWHFTDYWAEDAGKPWARFETHVK